MMATSTTCRICEDLDWDAFPNPLELGYSLPQGTKILRLNSQDLAKSSKAGCEPCSVIERGIKAIAETLPSTMEDPWNPTLPYMIDLVCKRGSTLKVLVKENHADAEDDRLDTALRFEYYTLADNPSPWPAFSAAIDVPRTLSLENCLSRTMEWLETCDKNHISCKSGKPSPLPRRVLDVGTHRLRNTISLYESQGESAKYIALSHCWGTTHMIKTTRATLEERKRGFRSSALPQTFQDAITVTRGLGIRYIWIDSLCILQDDRLDWEQEAAKMADIYENSYLNIAATRSPNSLGNCFGDRWVPQDVGIAGLWKWPLSTHELKQISDNCQYSVFVRAHLYWAHDDFKNSALLRSFTTAAPLLDRAWVFQERYLSRRTLHFHASELIFECNSYQGCECTGLEKDGLDQGLQERKPKQLYASRNDADVQEAKEIWLKVIVDYARTKITYESDRLPALSGFANRFQDRIHGQYLAGLWDTDLPRATLWRAEYPRLSEKDIKSITSWSWVSRHAEDVGYEPFVSGDVDFVKDEHLEVLGAHCTLSSPDPFGGVLDGELKFQGALLSATVTKANTSQLKGILDIAHLHFIKQFRLVVSHDVEDFVLITLFKDGMSLDFLPFHDPDCVEEGDIL